MTKFNFDELIDRRVVPALKMHPMVLGKDGAHLFPAGVADMDFKAPQVVRDAMAARLEHGVFGYEAVRPNLYPALAKWMETRHGWALETGHIQRAPNVLHILALAANVFSRAGDGIIVQPPVFFDFYDILQENGRQLALNPLAFRDGRYEMDFDGLEALACDPRNKMLFLCNPHNPVGRVWTADELRRLGEICLRHDVLVVSDEIHADVVFAGAKYTPFASLGDDFARGSITAISPAKSFNIASCSGAFAVLPDPARRKAYAEESSRLNANKNNAFTGAAMEAAYRDGAPWLAAVLNYLEGNLAMLRDVVAGLDGVELIEPEGTFLAWLDFRALGLTPNELTAFLRGNVGWAVTRGQAFGGEGEGFARFNFATTKARLEGALNQLATALPRR